MLPGSFKSLADFSPLQAFPYSSGINLLTPCPQTHWRDTCPNTPAVVPDVLFLSSGLLYERETASRTGKVTQMPISTFRALSKGQDVIIWVLSSKNHLPVSQGKEGYLPYRNISGFSLDLRGKFYLLGLLNTTMTFFLQVWLIFKASQSNLSFNNASEKWTTKQSFLGDTLDEARVKTPRIGNQSNLFCHQRWLGFHTSLLLERETVSMEPRRIPALHAWVEDTFTEPERWAGFRQSRRQCRQNTEDWGADQIKIRQTEKDNRQDKHFIQGRYL